MVFDSGTGRVILFGGSDRTESVYFNDTWAYDPGANTWTDLSPAGDVPPARSGQAMVYDSATEQVILFGGHSAEPFNDTWAYDAMANTWTNLQPERNAEPPGIRMQHSMVYDSAAGRVILFGGLDPGVPTVLNDTWIYDPGTNIWTRLELTGNLPARREFHSSVYDPATGRVILFGGMDYGQRKFSDTWVYGE